MPFRRGLVALPYGLCALFVGVSLLDRYMSHWEQRSAALLPAPRQLAVAAGADSLAAIPLPAEEPIVRRDAEVRTVAAQVVLQPVVAVQLPGDVPEPASLPAPLPPPRAVDSAPVVPPGIPGPTGPYVSYGEYTPPRPFINGFNPSDHVETRVSRLYYYRDAHRVAQIVNRDARSYNRAGVEMQQQLANKSRQIADQATDDRRAKEREAERQATLARQSERDFQQAEAAAQRSAAEFASARADLARQQALVDDPASQISDDERQRLREELRARSAALAGLESAANSLREQAQGVYAEIQLRREREAEAVRLWQAALAVEDRAREEQFRREVAAAQADPDTYAPGRPASEDLVRQVSLSVIGEGLIQLRGPIKGINEIRNMIHQIDAPVGQVRVGVHTVQINGEHGDRMEQVAGKIQRYIDHSRFLTLQSAEMFRRAITQVAAQKALEAGGPAGTSPEERHRRYLHTFFGLDFINELEDLDSEFLKSGNKLLSLHSMDSTSLASALFIMGLAKNSTRLEILHTFEQMTAMDLPAAEQNYFEAGLTCDGKHKLFDKHCRREEFPLLSQNARFQSIRGLFAAEILDDDTMTPIQREFVRLAQILKSRLIVELELKQRIMERSLIEERLGNRERELAEALEREQSARRQLDQSQAMQRDAQRSALAVAQRVQSLAELAQAEARKATELASQTRQAAEDMVRGIAASIVQDSAPAPQSWSEQQRQAMRIVQNAAVQDLLRPLGLGESLGPRIRKVLGDVGRVFPEQKQTAGEINLMVVLPQGNDPRLVIPVKVAEDGKLSVDLSTSEQRESVPHGAVQSANGRLHDQLDRMQRASSRIEAELSRFNIDQPLRLPIRQTDSAPTAVNSAGERNPLDALLLTRDSAVATEARAEEVVQRISSTSDAVARLVFELGNPEADVQSIYQAWLTVREALFRDLSAEQLEQNKLLIAEGDQTFQALLKANLDYAFAQRQAEASRRPLDHKKFLDMLVDEMEDKHIELLEGTRAHTANIDAYIKRLMTALDDDFNTQFYHPTFRLVRSASWMYDVQLGQVETTNVLANNRAFAKVAPQATMEFDLPKRDLLISEALNGAKATIDDLGALTQDPTFLALAKLKSGQPTSTPSAGATGGLSTVRNVLPGLPTDTEETVLGQQGPGGTQFGAALEALIPDPAIYKFETGTGWQVRPVIQPDGQALVFHFNYMYTTNIREPVRADEKHLGRVKRHFIDTDVQLSNFELREISRYTVALKAARTSRGVPLLEDVPLIGALWRPLPSDESSLQQNVILGQATIFPTLFDLMGLRWAPVVADLSPEQLSDTEFVVRNRRRALMNRVFDHSSAQVDEFLRIPECERRPDLYRSQVPIPTQQLNEYGAEQELIPAGPRASSRSPSASQPVTRAGYSESITPHGQRVNRAATVERLPRVEGIPSRLPAPAVP